MNYPGEQLSRSVPFQGRERGRGGRRVGGGGWVGQRAGGVTRMIAGFVGGRLGPVGAGGVCGPCGRGGRTGSGVPAVGLPA